MQLGNLVADFQVMWLKSTLCSCDTIVNLFRYATWKVTNLVEFQTMPGDEDLVLK